MKDILSGLPYVPKNSTALLESLNSLVIDQSCIFVTGDVKSLYTNISVQDAIVAVDSICREFKIKQTPLLIEMLRLVLTNNFFHCSELDKIFLKIWGLPTGTPAAVVISQIYMFWLEGPLVKKYNHLIKLYWRYIDDILLLWSGPRRELDNFMTEFNNLAPRITVNWSKPAIEVDYLDLHIYKYKDVSDNKISLVTETFQKPLNTYAYIPFNSFHPRHCKKAFIKGELIRYVKNSSNLKAFEKMKVHCWTRLRRIGYPPKFLLPIFELVQYSRRNFLSCSKIQKYAAQEQNSLFSYHIQF